MARPTYHIQLLQQIVNLLPVAHLGECGRSVNRFDLRVSLTNVCRGDGGTGAVLCWRLVLVLVLLVRRPLALGHQLHSFECVSRGRRNYLSRVRRTRARCVWSVCDRELVEWLRFVLRNKRFAVHRLFRFNYAV